MPTLPERNLRLYVALILAAVSLVTAYVTYLAAVRDGEAAALYALASEQWAEEQQVEQQIDAQIAQDQRLTARLDTEWQAYQRSEAEAAAVRSTDPARAARLDLEAQGTAARYAQLALFLRAAYPAVTETGLEYDRSATQQNLRIQDPHLYRASSELTRDAARSASDLASATKLVIVLLVAALFLFTLAHVIGGRRGVALSRIGAVSALGGVGWFAALQFGAAVPVLGAVVLIGVALLLVRIPRVRAWLGTKEWAAGITGAGSVPTQPPNMASASPDGAPSSGFDRYVAITIAVATLLGAGVGFFHGEASRASADEAWRAHDLAVEAIGALKGADESLAVQLDSYQEAVAHRVDSWNAAQAAAYAAWSGDPVEAARLGEESERLTVIAEALEERSELAPDLGRAGYPGLDDMRYIQGTIWEEPARLVALQDAANSAALNWGARQAGFVVVLAWLAVSAYLLGLSLIFRDRRARRVLASMGTALIVLASIQSALILSGPPPATAAEAEDAADAYADGVVVLTQGDPAHADALFAEALEVRPDFGLAHRERADALLQLGSASGLGFHAGFTEDAVDDAIAELEAARSNRADTAGVLLNLGAMLFHRSINTGSLSDMEQSIAMSEQGLRLGAGFGGETPHLNELIGQANLALAMLGSGDVDGAERGYRALGEGIALLAPYLRPYLVSAALAPIDLTLKAPRPASDETIAAMKGLVVASAYEAPTESAARIEAVTAELFASVVQWRATIHDFDPERDRLAVQWYRLDSKIGEWGALPVLSGPLTFNGFDSAGVFFQDGDDSYWGNTTAVLNDLPPACVQPGQYRVELYLNGELQASREATASAQQGDYSPVFARDVGVGMCLPGGWESTGSPGLSTTMAAPDGSRGIAVFRVDHAVSTQYDMRYHALDRAVGEHLDGMLPGLTPGVMLDPAGQPTVFKGFPAIWRLHGYDGGIVEVAAVMLVGGSMLVVCTYGPADWVTSQAGIDLLQSIVAVNPAVPR